MQKERFQKARIRQIRYYKNKFLRWLGEAGMNVNRRDLYTKARKRNDMIQNNKDQQRCYKVRRLRQEQFAKYIKGISMNQARLPTIITPDEGLKFIYPQKVVIRLQRNKNAHSEIDEITCSGDDNVVYLSVDKEEFFTKKLQRKEKPKKQDTNKSQQQFSISVPQMELDQSYYTQPSFVNQYFSQTHKQLYSVNLWHYIAHTKTKLHYDAHDNFLFQLKGIKKVFLRQPNTISKHIEGRNDNLELQTQKQKQKKKQFQKQYIKCHDVFGINSNHAVTRETHQNNKDNIQLEVQLKQNECLFIPRGWFHQVQSMLNEQGDNLAINFWGNTIEAYSLPAQQLQINLKQLIFRITQQMSASNVANWQNLQESIKEQYRKAYFYHYINRLSNSP